MIVDTSAVFAVLNQEPDAQLYADVIFSARIARISAGSVVELGIVAHRLENPIPLLIVGDFIRRSRLDVVPVTFELALAAWDGFAHFGKGQHPAGLNYGDCFAYALAKVTGEPLLFKGNDFSRTDVVPALPPAP